MSKKYSYDIIGDIHGCSLTLESLLDKLGYSQDSGGVYQHPESTAIFLGDFIDRGPYQREVLAVVKPMIESGSALSVMGNHEYNAIAYATLDANTGDYLRPHTMKNKAQHQAFLDAYADDTAAYQTIINWFKTLPLWLDLEDLRVVHACWDQGIIEKIGKPVLSNELLIASCNKSEWQHEAIETILKGKEIPLPEGHKFYDKDGNPRREIRVRWWDQNADTYQKAFLGPEIARTHIPDYEITGDHLIEYSHDAPPVFLGHYWMDDETPTPLTANIACTDYSVAKPGGKLVAYRWSGEKVLLAEKYVTVAREEDVN